MKKRGKLSIERLVSLLEEELDDPRREGGNLQHKLVDVLVLMLLGVFCGCEKWSEIAKALLQNEKTFKASAPRKSKRASNLPDYARLIIGFPAIDFK